MFFTFLKLFEEERPLCEEEHMWITQQFVLYAIIENEEDEKKNHHSFKKISIRRGRGRAYEKNTEITQHA